jgi:hypothetical protein
MEVLNTPYNIIGMRTEIMENRPIKYSKITLQVNPILSREESNL